MQNEVQTIFSKNWDEIDKKAEEMHFNRSQFIDFVYNYWKNKSSRDRKIQNIINLALIALSCIIIILVIK